MSEDSIPAAGDAAPAESPAPAKTVRRVSNPRPKKKVAKKAVAESPVEAPSAAESAPVEAAPVVEAPAAPAPVERESVPVREEAPSRDEIGHRANWPEPETIQGESAAGGKRKRRRKKKGGNPSAGPAETHAPRPQPSQQSANEASAPAQAPRPPQQPQAHPQSQAPRPQLDPEQVAKKAWRIYLSEVSEEGLALIGDNDARDLTRRSFRLAEIFLEEQARRTR